jgi:glycyl-tRNA synthetase beta chain
MDLLFELGTEEIPARFLEDTIHQLKERGESLLDGAGFVFKEIHSWATPRRLVLYAVDFRFDSSKAVVQKKGPPVSVAFSSDGQPTLALQGFLKKESASLKQAEIREGYVYLKKSEEKPPKEVLSRVLPEIITGLSFPKTMRWGNGGNSFVRPVRWACAMWGEEPIPLSLFSVESAPYTRGLRFFSGQVKLSRAEDYEKALEENFVLVNPQKRKERIERTTRELALEVGGSPSWPEGLKDELVYLLEYPTPFLGSFPEEYLSLPADVLITTMRHHQKHLPLIDDQGKLLNFFVCFRNGPALGEEIVIKGNEQALTGRLEDARLFFMKDQGKSLEERVTDLRGIFFYEKLGTLFEKTQRLEEISLLFCDTLKIPEPQRNKVLRTAHLSKADLTTSLVQELPELQGIMGKEYALLAGEDREVAEGIAEHYYPRFWGDREPKSTCGTIVSIADRIDALTCFFGLGLEPTGSSDPFALRRQGQGLVLTIMKNALPLDLAKVVEIGEAVSRKIVPWDQEKRAHLIDFLKQRLRFILEEDGYSFEMVSCVLQGQPLVPHEVKEKARLLNGLDESDLRNLVLSFKRMKNILKSAGKFNPVIWEEGMEEQEREFLAKMEEITKRDNSRPELLLQNLLEISPYIGKFFDSVMVMVEEERRRESRLTLLLNAREFLGRFGDFSSLPF